MMTLEQIIKKHIGSYVEATKVVTLIRFLNGKPNPEKSLEACLHYRSMGAKSNEVKLAATQRKFDIPRATIYRLCDECSRLSL